MHTGVEVEGVIGTAMTQERISLVHIGGELGLAHLTGVYIVSRAGAAQLAPQ